MDGRRISRLVAVSSPSTASASIATVMSSFPGRSMDEHEAASIVAGMHSSSSKNTTGEDVPKKVRHARKKRIHSSESNNNESKRASSSSAASAKKKSPPIATTAAAFVAKKSKKEPTKLPPEPEEEMDATAMVFLAPTLKPAPYFYYSDHSLEGDDDPLTPIIAAGSVPTFPASEYEYIVYKYICIYLFILADTSYDMHYFYSLSIANFRDACNTYTPRASRCSGFRSPRSLIAYTSTT